jgi:Rad3-related DNA helicase
VHKHHLDLTGAFPFDRHPQMRIGQKHAIEHLQGSDDVTVHELPVGSGKTALGYTFLKAHAKRGAQQLFYIAPNKTQVEQVKALHPDVHAVFGRNEYPCFYYEGEGFKADEIPCSLLSDCPHRVNQETGATYTAGVIPCQYLQQKFEAKQGGRIVAATDAFFLYTVLFSGEFKPDAVVIDEAHRLAQCIRSVLSTDLTDWKIERAMEAVEETSPKQCEKLAAFLASMKHTVKRYALGKETLLEEPQVKQLYDVLIAIDAHKLENDARNAIRSGRIDTTSERDVLKQVEDIARSVRRFQHALRFAMRGATERGYPLNFVVAYGKTELGPHDHVQYRLTIRDYYVIPIIRKILPKSTYAFSATIADPEIFAFETGIVGNFASIPSGFPPENARIYMPVDTADLAVKKRRRRDKTQMLRKAARAAKQFADKGVRSLVIIVSNEERLKFLEMAREENLNTLSYGNGMPPRECAQRFRSGEGDCLVGTASNFGEGLDLPAQTAPVIFYYRPGYARPDDPQAVFEMRRFGRRKAWALWKWRVMVELLQVRGRNIRSSDDLGVTFLISQQFRSFAFKTLPEWLRPSYRGNWTFEQCVEDAEKLLRKP